MKFIEKYILEKIEPVHGYKYNVKVLRTVDGINYYNCGCGKYFKTEKEAQVYKRTCEKEQKRELKERAQLEKALKSLESCTGDCKHCEKCHVYTSSTNKALYMAVGCDLLPLDMFGAIANYPSELQHEAINAVLFELS